MGSNGYLTQTIICSHFQTNTTSFISRVNTPFLLLELFLYTWITVSLIQSFILFNSCHLKTIVRTGCRKHKYLKVPLNLHVDNWPQHLPFSPESVTVLFMERVCYGLEWKACPIQCLE